MGKYRIVAGTSFAGHNGLRSVAENMDGMDGFMRVGIGIGRPESREPEIVTKYVNSEFSPEDLDIIQNKVFPKIYKEHLLTLFFSPQNNLPKSAGKTKS